MRQAMTDPLATSSSTGTRGHPQKQYDEYGTDTRREERGEEAWWSAGLSRSERERARRGTTRGQGRQEERLTLGGEAGERESSEESRLERDGEDHVDFELDG
jgi:hypothetical protein